MKFISLIPVPKVLCLALLLGLAPTAKALDFPGPEPGKATVSLVLGQSLGLSN